MNYLDQIPTRGRIGRPRVGLLIAASDTGIEIELPSRVGGVASTHYSRVDLASVSLDELRSFLDRALEQIPSLCAIDPDLIVVGCTSATFVHGPQEELRMLDLLSEAAQVPVFSTARLAADMLRRSGSRVRLRTTYTEAITQLEADYFQALGFDVVDQASLGIQNDNVTAGLSVDELSRFVAGDDDSDVVLLSCTNIRTWGYEGVLENSARKPVVGSISAIAQGIRDYFSATLPKEGNYER